MPRAVAGPLATDTSYLCVVDADGNAFSATPSDGARESPIVPGLGFIISSRGVQSWLDPDHPASIRPGKRPRLTPNPGIVVREGEFVMPYGTPGADVQPQAMVQFLVGALDGSLDLQAATETPRVATYSFPATHDPHVYRPGLVKVEGRVRPEVAEGLSARGHAVELWPDWISTAGSIGAVMRKADGGVFGAADPRRMAYALGW
jgi:gamma-glutamyltranspeptidase/glutathione hydrolase